MGLLPSVAQGQSESTDRVHVRLHHGASVSEAQLTAEQGDLTVSLPGRSAPLLHLRSGETVTVGRRNQEVFLRRKAGSGLYAQALQVQPTGEQSTWTLAPEEGTPTTYSGTLRITSSNEGSSLVMVNGVPLPDYVASVVASEYGLEDQAGRRAMAVVARTYALFAIQKFEGNYDHVDGTASQVYAGLDAVTPEARQATEATSGQIVTHDGTPIQAVYSSSSGGHTASNEAVWATTEAQPYLRGREDPYDSASPHHRWSTTVRRTALLDALSQAQGVDVSGFTLDEQTAYGRAATIRLLHPDRASSSMNANDFRLAVNRGVEGTPLKSTWFDATRDGSRYTFEGRGFGHGVGLSQWGAHAMAEQGHSYREILTFYYSGVDIETLDGRALPTPTAPVADNTAPERSASPPPSSRAPADTSSSSSRIGW